MALVDDYLTVPEAAAKIGVTPGRVRQMLLAGEIQGEQVPPGENNRWLITVKEVQRVASVKKTTGRPRNSRTS